MKRKRAPQADEVRVTTGFHTKGFHEYNSSTLKLCWRRNWHVTLQYLLSQTTLILSFIKHHDRKEVRKAAKKAKTFETQKILKKMKDARCVASLLS